MDFHPLADLFPMMAADEFGRLVDDIRENGLRDAVIGYEGRILDGRNRYLACEAAGVPVRTEPYTGPDPLAFVVSKNLHRRHLTESQRAMVAAKIANLTHGGERHEFEYQAANLPLDIQTVTQAEAAQLLNVSERTVREAVKVKNEGIPELAAAVTSGDVSVSAAAAVARLPPAVQRAVISAGPSEVKAEARRQRERPAVCPEVDVMVSQLKAFESSLLAGAAFWSAARSATEEMRWKISDQLERVSQTLYRRAMELRERG